MSTLEIESETVLALSGVERLTDQLFNLIWALLGLQKLLKRCKLFGWRIARYLCERSGMDTKKPLASLQEVLWYASVSAHLKLERLVQISVGIGLNEA